MAVDRHELPDNFLEAAARLDALADERGENANEIGPASRAARGEHRR